MRLAVAAHDSGGSEIVSSWVEKTIEQPVHALLEGPAKEIFQRKLNQRMVLHDRLSFKTNLQKFDFVLTGTSWASDLEKLIHRWCRHAEVRCAAILDHWTEYPYRFTLQDGIVLPNEIWVTDRYAEAIARRDFPGAVIELKPNRYLESMVGKIKAMETNFKGQHHGERILYCSEPTSVVALKKTGNALTYGYTEFSALRKLLEFLIHKQYPVSVLKLRPHPSEPEDKYQYLLDEPLPFPVQLSHRGDLAAECAWADTIIGCDSMVMTIGVLAGKKVFSCIPDGGKPLTNPMPEIRNIYQ